MCHKHGANRKTRSGEQETFPVHINIRRSNVCKHSTIGSVLSRDEAEASASPWPSEMSSQQSSETTSIALLRLQNMMVLLKDLNLSNSVGLKVCFIPSSRCLARISPSVN